jgi:hypothetical protein
MVDRFRVWKKAIIALLGGVSAWGVTASPDGIQNQEWYGLAGVVATALGVAWALNAVDGEGE